MLRKPLGLAVALALLAGCASDNGFHYTPPAQIMIAPEGLKIVSSFFSHAQGWQRIWWFKERIAPLQIW
jgi:gamma-glutamyltranspeptidase/glutathione hydrolase